MAVHFEEVSGNGTIFSYIVVRQALVPGRVPPTLSGSSNSWSSRGYGSARSSMPIQPMFESRVQLRIIDLGESGYRIPEFVVKERP